MYAKIGLMAKSNARQNTSIVFFPGFAEDSYQQKQPGRSCPDFQTSNFIYGYSFVQAYIN
jgi:hypothetical protein